MEKYFANYNQSLALKELGFNDPCLSEFWKRDDGEIFPMSGNELFELKYQKEKTSNVDDMSFIINRPLKSQVFEWAREKHNLVIEPCVPFQRTYQTEDDYFEILEFGYRIFEFDQFRGGRRNTIEWDGYENSVEEIAESACIDKLIEIVKNK